jgi:hypothetical protein
MNTEPMKWVAGTTLFRQPKGHNDIYWCETSKAATVILKGGSLCQRCGQRLADDLNPHVFVLHIEREKISEPNIARSR